MPRDLNQTWTVGRKCQVVSIYKCPPPKNGGTPQIWGAKTLNFYDFFVTFALDTAYLRNETSHRNTKYASVNLQCVP